MEAKYELADNGEGIPVVEMSTLPPVVPGLKMKDKVDDIGEGSSMVVLNVQELEMSMKRSLRTMARRVEKTKPCIYRVFPPVREQHGQDYDPRIIAIGPFHHDNKALKAMEPLKWRYLRQLIYRNRKKNTLPNYINVIGEAITEARGYYSEQVELGDNEFVKMMVLDGGFLIEYLVKAYTDDLEHLKEVNWNLPFFRRDLLLLENQFPFPILQLLFDSSDIPDLVDLNKDGNPVTLTELAVSYVTHNKLESLPEASRPETIHHLLHVYHAFIRPTPQSDNQLSRSCCGYAAFSTMKSLASATFLWLLSTFNNCHVPLTCCGSCRRRSKEQESRTPTGTQTATQLQDSEEPTGTQTATKFQDSGATQTATQPQDSGVKIMKMKKKKKKKKKKAPRGIQTATQLKDSGVKFMKKKEDTGNFLDVKFYKEAGVMEIPKLPIQEATISQFRNLIAFEQCCPEAGSHFTSHATLMNNLIDTPMDVAILKDAHIIESKLGEDKEVAELFNNLCMGAYLDFDKHHNHQLFEDVVAYSNMDRHKWEAKLMHDYFSNPWAIISLFAAVVLLCLTFLQTFFAIYAYIHPQPNGN